MNGIVNNRGMTLIEIMIALGISAFFLLGLYSVFLAQDKSYKTQSLVSEMQENGRNAMRQLTTNIRGAGFGIHPWEVFEFCGGVPCMDNAGGSDEITFYTKNPDPRNWGRVVAATPTEMQLQVNYVNYRVRRGQILLVICSKPEDTERRENDTAYVVSAGNEVPMGGLVTIQFDATAPPKFREGTKFTAGSCFTSGSAMAYFVDRFHYYINTVGDPQHPYLMLDTGTDINGDGNINNGDHIPVAADVETIQFVYIMNNGTEFGESLGVAEEPDPSLPFPELTDTFDSPLRMNNNPANIRFLRISVLVRSPKHNSEWYLPDGTYGECANYPDRCRPRVENYDGAPPGSDSDGFIRLILQETVPVWNLRSTAVIYEPLS